MCMISKSSLSVGRRGDIQTTQADGLLVNRSRDGNYVEHYLWVPQNPAGLCIARIFFGFLMFLDVVYERGLPDLHARFGNPYHCHFPLFSWIKPLSLPWMGVVYSLMWLGTIGIMLGYKFRISCFVYLVTYWYVFLLNKVFWNNHSYLYGLLAILFLGTSANHYKSIDALLNPSIRGAPVPRWNYWILRFQIFLMYFYAGIKKWDPDWLNGHCMSNLDKHWVFSPFKAVFSEDFVNLFLVHVVGFVFDLTIGFWLLIETTRPVSLVVACTFHLINSQIFSLGMFSYVCLAMLPIFSSPDWPNKLVRLFKPLTHKQETILSSPSEANLPTTWPKQLTLFGIICYVVVQLVLPFSQSLTPGYAGWTPGLYGYSWDMMVHGWENLNVVIETGNQTFINPDVWVSNDRWSSHPDTIYQFAQCASRNLRSHGLRNFSLHIDIWKSLNGRLQQRMVDPTVDFLSTSWSPFRETPWILPLLDKGADFRKEAKVQRDYWVNQGKKVLIVGDFPGLVFETSIPEELIDVELHVLKGRILVEMPRNFSVVLAQPGDKIRIDTNVLYKIRTVSDKHSVYLYTFDNHSAPPKNESTFVSSNFFRQQIWIFGRSCILFWNSLLYIVQRLSLVYIVEQDNL